MKKFFSFVLLVLTLFVGINFFQGQKVEAKCKGCRIFVEFYNEAVYVLSPCRNFYIYVNEELVLEANNSLKRQVFSYDSLTKDENFEKYDVKVVFNTSSGKETFGQAILTKQSDEWEVMVLKEIKPKPKKNKKYAC